MAVALVAICRQADGFRRLTMGTVGGLQLVGNIGDGVS
jgi:hypothetical protein